MTRENQKDKELLKFASLIMSAEDYGQRIQRLNGMRMGLTNKYNNMPEEMMDKTTKGRRLNLWKQLVEEYK